ncbi:MAG: type II toxin-antitoxin system Phd/YefM family antitoxin [Saprospiraceae bacterium]|nr:type II toxin-antitoxin system Phd/YefM family antitoxin [Saprospiraceae bacterium]
MTVVNIHEAKSNLSALIQKALDGEEVIIAKNNVPIVSLQPLKVKTKKRKFGALKGQITEAADCWEPDKELEDSFYNS